MCSAFASVPHCIICQGHLLCGDKEKAWSEKIKYSILDWILGCSMFLSFQYAEYSQSRSLYFWRVKLDGEIIAQFSFWLSLVWNKGHELPESQAKHYSVGNDRRRIQLRKKVQKVTRNLGWTALAGWWCNLCIEDEVRHIINDLKKSGGKYGSKVNVSPWGTHMFHVFTGLFRNKKREQGEGVVTGVRSWSLYGPMWLFGWWWSSVFRESRGLGPGLLWACIWDILCDLWANLEMWGSSRVKLN